MRILGTQPKCTVKSHWRGISRRIQWGWITHPRCEKWMGRGHARGQKTCQEAVVAVLKDKDDVLPEYKDSEKECSEQTQENFRDSVELQIDPKELGEFYQQDSVDSNGEGETSQGW